MMHVKVEHL